VRSYDDKRIRYFRHTENIGQLPNTNFCLNQAKGDYFLQLHDDDAIDPDFIEICMKAERLSPNVGVIRTGVRVIDAEGKVLSTHPNNMNGSSLKEFFIAWFEHKTSWYLCNTLFQTKGIKEAGGFHSKRHHVSDGVAIVYMADKFGQVGVEDVKARFRKHSGEITFSVAVKDWSLDYHALFEQMCAVTNNDEEVRQKGAAFFCKMNYQRANNILSRVERFLTFFMIYRLFDFRYPPDTYVFSPALWRILRSVKRVLKK